MLVHCPVAETGCQWMMQKNKTTQQLSELDMELIRKCGIESWREVDSAEAK
jgi:hypothetical protein